MSCMQISANLRKALGGNAKDVVDATGVWVSLYSVGSCRHGAVLGRSRHVYRVS